MTSSIRFSRLRKPDRVWLRQHGQSFDSGSSPLCCRRGEGGAPAAQEEGLNSKGDASIQNVDRLDHFTFAQAMHPGCHDPCARNEALIDQRAGLAEKHAAGHHLAAAGRV